MLAKGFLWLFENDMEFLHFFWNFFPDLSQRVDAVKDENLKLKSENQVWGKLICQITRKVWFWICFIFIGLFKICLFASHLYCCFWIIRHYLWSLVTTFRVAAYVGAMMIHLTKVLFSPYKRVWHQENFLILTKNIFD